MNKTYLKLVVFLLSTITTLHVFADSRQVAYCYDCEGNLTIYVDQTHGASPNLTIDYALIVDGDTTLYTAQTGTPSSPAHNNNNYAIVVNTSFANLLRCEGGRKLYASCGTPNDFVVFYHPNMPRGVPITIQLLEGYADAKFDALCNTDLARVATFYIPTIPVVAGGGSYCVNQSIRLSASTTQYTNTIYNVDVTNQQTTLYESQPTDTSHTIQWQVADNSAGPWTSLPGANNQTLEFPALQTVGTKYYRSIYMSAYSTQIIPAHWDTIQEIRNPDPAIDTVIVPFQRIWIPESQILVPGGGCPLTSNPVAVRTYLAPGAHAGSDTTVCVSPVFKTMGGADSVGLVYSWLPTAGLSNAAVANPTISLNTPRNTTYVLTVRDPSCPVDATDTALIVVNPFPTATITGDVSVCNNATSPLVTFTATGGFSPHTFTYTLNGGASQSISTSASSNSVTLPISTSLPTTFNYELVSVVEGSSAACMQTQNDGATVVVHPLPTATISGSTSRCLNAASPSLVFAGANGTGPYTITYVLNNGTNQVITTGAGHQGLLVVPTSVAGTFTYTLVSVADANCSQAQTDTAQVKVYDLTANLTGSATVCQNATSPTLTFTGAGSVAPYVFTYTINNGASQTNTSIAATSTGTVSATTNVVGDFVYSMQSIRDANNLVCNSVSTATVKVNSKPTATISNDVDVCLNEPNVSVTFTGAGGIAPYTISYTINNGTTQTVATTGNVAVINVPTGVAGAFVYDLVGVADANCSQAQTGRATVTVHDLVANLTNNASVCVNDASPVIRFAGAGGTAPYRFIYSINNGTNQTIVSSGVASTVTLSPPTNVVGNFQYSLLSIEDDNNLRCASPSDVTITVNNIPTASISGDATLCLNDPNPLVTFTGVNGVAPYTFTYSLNGAASETITTTVGNAVSISAPTNVGGTFTYDLISVADAHCSQTQTGSAVISINPLGATLADNASVCLNGASPDITFTGGGGTAPYTFTYTINGGGSQTITSAGTTDVAVISAPTNVVGNFNYSLASIEDANNLTCLSSSSVTISVTNIPTASISGDATRCLNEPTPPIVFKGAGGTRPYTITYTINGGANLTVVTGLGDSAIVYAPTTSGGTFTYALVSVADVNCSQTQTGTAVVQINALSASLLGTDTVCQNSGTSPVSITGSGGVAPYTFTYKINTNPNQIVVSTGATSVATLAAQSGVVGTFTYSLMSVADANGESCVSADDITVTVSSLPTASVTGDAIRCLNGPNPTVVFTGATTVAPYTFTYSLNGAPSQTVSSTAGSNSVTLTAPTDVAGTYEYRLLSVADGTAEACQQNQNDMATVRVNNLQASIVGSTTVCQNATSPILTLSGAGGTAPYQFTYTINNAAAPTATTTNVSSSLDRTVPTAATGNFVYEINGIADGSGLSCASVASATVSVNALPTATIVGATSLCENSGTAPIVFTGSNTLAPYEFTYRLNNGTPTTIVSDNTGIATLNAVSTTPGQFTYELMSVQDASTTMCNKLVTASQTVTVTPLPTASITSSANAICQTGSATVTFSGNNSIPPYTFRYTINGGTVQTRTTTGLNTSIPINVSTIPNTYVYALVDVTDGRGCSQTQGGTVTVQVDGVPTATSESILRMCSDGALVINGTSSNGSVQWIHNGAGSITAGATTAMPTYTADAADAGNVVTLTMTVTSTNSCVPLVATATTQIGVFIGPTASSSGDTAICVNNTITIAGMTATNGAIDWVENGAGSITAGQTTLTPTYTPELADAGRIVTLTMTVTSESNCNLLPVTASVLLTVNALPQATVSSIASVCKGNATNVVFRGINGLAPYRFNYELNGNDTTGVSTLPTGEYFLARPNSEQGVFNYALLSVSDANNCSDIATSATQITVLESPEATLKDNVIVCKDAQSPVLTLEGKFGDGTYSFTYTDGITGLKQTLPSNGNTRKASITVPTNVEGIYLYTLDSVFSGVCGQPQKQQVAVKVTPPLTANLLGDTEVCQGTARPSVKFIGKGTAPYIYKFSVNGNTTELRSSKDTFSFPVSTVVSGIYTYSLITVQDIYCTNTASDTVTVQIHKKPEASFVVKTEVLSLLEPEVEVLNASLEANSWTWDFGDSTNSILKNPDKHRYKDTGTYKIQLVVMNQEGYCYDTTYQTVIVQYPFLLYMPNSFTPNGDGTNDEFRASGDGFIDFKMEVYDRWGDLIFASDDINKGWDGTVNGGSAFAQADVYVYVLKIKDLKRNDNRYRGTFSLVR